MPRRAAFAACSLIAVCLGAVPATRAQVAPAGAIAIDLRVVDRDGNAVPDADVMLSTDYAGKRCGTTSMTGRVTCTVTKPGTFMVDVRARANPFFVPPDTPFRVTVRPGETHVTADLALRLGDRVMLSIILEHAAGSGVMRFVEVTRGEVREFDINRAALDVVLPPGEWRIETTPVPGWLLTELVLDRTSLPMRDALLVTTGGVSHTLTWRYESPILIEGETHWAGGDGPGPPPRATLLAPGPLLADALARGTPFASPAMAEEDRYGRYWLHLADGTWLIEPVSEHIDTCEPASITVTMNAGETRWQDFTARPKWSDDRPPQGIALLVVVSGLDRSSRDQAIVELREAGAAFTTPPLKTERSSWGSVRFENLHEGSYVVSAGHELTGDASLAVFDLKNIPEDKPRKVRIELPPTAALAIDGTVKDGAPLTDATVAVEVTAEMRARLPSISLVSDESLRAKRLARTVKIDSTGRARIVGLLEGEYVARAKAPPDRSGPPILVRVGTDEKRLEPETAFHLGKDGEKTLYVRPVPAAALAARLRCLDRGPLPPRTALRLLLPRTYTTPDGDDAAYDAARPGPQLWPLVDRRDERALAARPFEPGTYVVGLRPDGFARWTWFGSGERRSLAHPVGLGGGGVADLDLVEIDCGPTVRLEPSARSKAALPDVSDIEVSARYEPLSAEGKRTGEAVAPRVDAADGVLRLRRLPEGQGVLHATVTSPFFIPGAVEPVGGSVTLALARGGEAVVPLQLDDVGGAIVVEGGGAALRVTPAGGEPRVIPADAQGRLRAEHLAIGTWTVEVCADVACRAVARTIGEVDVTRAAWTRVAAGP